MVSLFPVLGKTHHVAPIITVIVSSNTINTNITRIIFSSNINLAFRVILDSKGTKTSNRFKNVAIGLRGLLTRIEVSV